MIIPILCFECGKPTGHLWDRYIELVQKYRNEGDQDEISDKNTKLSPEGRALKDLNMTRDCCRIIFLSNADLSTIISSR